MIRELWRRIRNREEGITGLETAIILIAFVIVASVFAYVVLSSGLFSSQKAKEAVTAGMDYSQGDAVILTDADLQDPPEVIPEMIAKWREGYDVVYGVRSEREGETWFKLTTAGI